MTLTPPPTSPRRRRPTLEQVARYAGVSRATVSRVVNGSTTVDPALRAIVDQAVSDLGYSPNLATRALMTRKTDTIALVAAETDTRVFGDPFFAQIVRGVSKEITPSGFRLTLSMTESEAEAAALVRYLAAGHTDGVLLISEHGGHRIPQSLVQAGIPVVIGGRPIDPELKVRYVDNGFAPSIAWPAEDRDDHGPPGHVCGHRPAGGFPPGHGKALSQGPRRVR